MKKMIKKLVKNKKGLSLIEVMVAIFVFSIIITVSMAVATMYLKGSLTIKKYQENSEELSLAMNYISTDIRMSSLVSPVSTSNLNLTNNNGDSVTYAFSGGGLTRNGSMIIDKVSGSFYVINSNGIPRVTIAMWKTNYTDFSVETTISMRSGYHQ